MKKAISEYKSGGYIFGKEFVIIVTVVFSTLSFTLGFVVGKKVSGNPQPTAEAVRPVPVEHAPEPAQAAAAPEAATPAPDTQQSVPIMIVQNQDAAQQSSANERTPAAKQPDPARPERKPSSPAVRAALEKEVPQEQKEVYTVQVGAFKSADEAKRVKQLCEKKGLKTAVLAAKGGHGEKIFKVRTGEFRDRKEAEILALKLKKTEGWKTFVTAKAD